MKEVRTIKTSSKKLSRGKFFFFSILPCLALLLAVEITVRIAGWAKPSLRSWPLEEELVGLFQYDEELFWSLRPRFSGMLHGKQVMVNRIGLRGPEVGTKTEGEFRILSLGESSAFGIGVEGAQTYSAVLQGLLNENAARRKYTVINAGVPAYSSFQSLKFLELRGLRLQPDLVLFYHELNDYLPSSLRDSSNSELGIAKTDRQLFESRLHSLGRYLTESSALVQFLQRQWALHCIKRFNVRNLQPVHNPLPQIGLPDLRLESRLVSPRVRNANPQRGADFSDAHLNEVAIGRRVSEVERLQNLHELAALCRSRGIALLLIHPSYLESTRHSCVLTRFCRDNQVPMFEAYDVLHPTTNSSERMFLDSWHPTAAGHRLLAEGLYRQLDAQGFLPSTKEGSGVQPAASR